MKYAFLVVALLAVPGSAFSEIILENPRNRVVENAKFIGLSLGSPAMVNAELVFDTKITTVMLTGMYWNSEFFRQAKGIQGGLSLLRSKRTNSFSSLSFVGGWTESDEHKYAYGGLEGLIQSDGWFFALGLILTDQEDVTGLVHFGFLWKI